jgi:hypothetical protein
MSKVQRNISGEVTLGISISSLAQSASCAENRVAHLRGSRFWLRVPCRKIPVSRYPPIKLKQKVALCGANKNRPSPSWGNASNSRLFTSDSSLPAFTSSLLRSTVQYLERTSLIFSQSLQGESACCKIADELEDDLMDDRVRERSLVSARKTTMI